jgi:ubiquinone/menaquinone biosynthesis C-methylase UbiE
MENNTNKFTDKVDNYDKFRPNYPQEILLELKRYNFSKNSIVADIGSGTGKLTQLFLENGNKTYAVEPNDNMRNKADILFKNISNYISINGTAEDSTLLDKSIDCITVGQAFHWFDPIKTIKEFKRIIKDNGILALIWNTRKVNTLFLNSYENIIKKYSKKHSDSGHRNIDDNKIKEYFNKNYRKIIISHHQKYDFDGVIGRYLSSSYSVNENTQKYVKVYNELKKTFEQNKEDDNKVRFNYDTEMYIGNI